MSNINQTPPHPCTECGGDAKRGISNLRTATSMNAKPVKQLVGKDERLCLSCAKERGVPDFILNSLK